MSAPAPLDRLYHDAALAQFYDLDNAWGPDLAYCHRLAADVGSVLDLGCGTGRFAAACAMSGVKQVIGVDPAGSMLDIARRRAGGDKVQWAEADARHLRLDRRFDLIVLTGHAFQVFLTDADRLGVLQAIAAHLASDGRFIFDSRNPVSEEWRDWRPELTERMLAHPEMGMVKAWNDVAYDAATGIVSYETHYRCQDLSQPDDGHFSAVSQISFPDQATIAGLLDEAGLRIECWLGDWSGAAYEPHATEIIPIGGLRTS